MAPLLSPPMPCFRDPLKSLDPPLLVVASTSGTRISSRGRQIRTPGEIPSCGQPQEKRDRYEIQRFSREKTGDHVKEAASAEGRVGVGA